VPSGFGVHDDETVYVVADAKGTVRDVVVVDWLRVEGNGTLTLLDPGEVSAAEALEDDIEPVLTQAGVEWDLTSMAAATSSTGRIPIGSCRSASRRSTTSTAGAWSPILSPERPAACASR
jgi:hypothetical protein